MNLKNLFLAFLVVCLAAAIGNFGGLLQSMIGELVDAAEFPNGEARWTAKRWDVYQFATIGALALSMLLIVFIAWVKREWVRPKAQLRDSPHHARKVVIMGLSYGESVVEADGRLTDDAENLTDSLIEASFEAASAPVRRMFESGLLRLNKHGRPDRNSPGAFTWVQNLRALREHVLGRTLELVVVVPSKDTVGQAPAFAAFGREITKEAMGCDVPFLILDEAPDYAQFRDVLNALENARSVAIRHLRKTKGRIISDGDICIDATSGTAAFSIAAGIVTLNHNSMYSYVTTFEGGEQPCGGIPKYYDAILDMSVFVSDN